MTLHIESAAGVTSPAVACHGDIQQHKQAPANQQDTHHTNATSSDTSKAVSPQFDLFGRAQPDPVAKAANYSAKGYRNLPKTWQGRAAANNACIQLANKILAEGRAATAEEQASLMLFTGYGASDLANNCFRDPGTTAFRSSSWEDIGQKLEKIASKDELASLKRSTQYAHFTPEKLIRHMWRAVSRLGFTGGRVLEPGMGTGLFLAHLPEQFQAKTRFFGIEADPLTAKIARILFPRAKILQEDFAHTRLGRDFSLAIGNPPYSSMVVQNDPNYRGKGLLLHDYFILKSLDALQPGAVAAFVTSQGTMNKSSSSVRRQIAATCDLLGAIRLPEGTFAAEAGTNVGVDLLFFKKREANEPSRGLLWVETISATAPGHEGVAINEYFVDHPHMVLGSHGVTRGRYSSAPTYVCRAIPGRNLDHDITQAIASLPANVFSASPELDATEEAEEVVIASGTNSRLREGSYFLSATRELYQLIDGSPEKIAVKRKRGDTGIFRKHAIIIGDLIPIRDTIRSILATQERFEDSSALQKTLNEQYDSFVARHGPINRTEISVQQEADGGEKRETHRYPNLAPFRDDPDCWLVASIENYNVDTHEATKSAIFTAIVVGREVQPQLANASDALAVCLNARGQVDVEYMADLLNRPAADVIKELGAAIYLDPAIDEWVTADEYLSGKVRIKLSTAIAAAAGNPAYQRNVSALEECQPVDIPPSDITARLGSPWIPAVDISLFIFETLGVKTEVYHQPRLATWSVQEYRFHGATEAKARWETHRYPLHQLVTDALNSRTPAIHDTVVDAEGRETRVINSVETEAAKERLSAFRTEFERWIWNDPDRSVRLARIYNDNFNNLVARKFDGSHLALAGTNPTFTFYPHQKNAIWRQICNGGTYIAHKVGAGKTATMAAGIMEQKRLGLVDKPMLVVPNHCLGQIAIEYLRLYPAAKILVADEQNFAREKRRRFLARAATGEWDCIIITHSAFRFVPTPAKFEADFLATQIEEFEHLLTQVDRDDRLSRKRLEQQKEAFSKRIEALATATDDFLTMEEIGTDQIYVDEAQEFRKLSFTTSQGALKGIDPNGSQMAWDLFCKAEYIRMRRKEKTPGARVDRALNLASGTPITNTLGEMFTIQRYMARDALVERNMMEFDAWAATFGNARTELELQPSGKYKPVTRFAEFVNVPELITMFRTFGDVVDLADLKQYVQLPVMKTGRRQIITAPPSENFRAYQDLLAKRIKLIEERTGKPNKGDDILLSVITDGRHAAIDMRLVDPWSRNEPNNKLNKLIDNVFRIHNENADNTYLQPNGEAYELRGATQMIFSDLGTLAVEATRQFSAYRWIRDELVARGIPSEQIAIVHDYNGMQAKNRLFADMRAGKVRITIGSTKKMGTGVNAQNRLKALHHLDVPWIPSDIEQREGRIERQGNQNEEIEVVAYATEGSMDATMWQTNERKARFIAAALSGDRSVRRVEDLGEDAVNQFSMAKAIASGDPRLMQRAGLESEINRLQRLRDAHFNDRHTNYIRLERAKRDIVAGKQHILCLTNDIAIRDASGRPLDILIDGQAFPTAKDAGRALRAKMQRLDNRALGMSRSEASGTIATAGQFEIEYTAYHVAREIQSETVLKSPNRSYELRIWSQTPGAVAIEHIQRALAGIDDHLIEAQRQLSYAERMVKDYSASLTQAFPYEDELVRKRAELEQIDSSLAANQEDQNEPDPTGGGDNPGTETPAAKNIDDTPPIRQRPISNISPFIGALAA